MDTEKVVNLIHSIVKRFGQLEELLEEYGIDLCSGSVREESNVHSGTEIEAHVYRGIRKLAELFGEETFHPVNIIGETLEYYLAFKYDGILFYELGHENERGVVEWR